MKVVEDSFKADEGVVAEVSGGMEQKIRKILTQRKQKKE